MNIEEKIKALEKEVEVVTKTFHEAKERVKSLNKTIKEFKKLLEKAKQIEG